MNEEDIPNEEFMEDLLKCDPDKKESIMDQLHEKLELRKYKKFIKKDLKIGLGKKTLFKKRHLKKYDVELNES